MPYHHRVLEVVVGTIKLGLTVCYYLELKLESAISMKALGMLVLHSLLPEMQVEQAICLSDNESSYGCDSMTTAPWCLCASPYYCCTVKPLSDLLQIESCLPNMELNYRYLSKSPTSI